jgi:hypothetical protein
MSDDQKTQEDQAPELDREERRLERLRLVVNPWPTPGRTDEEAPPPNAA